jgi:hypothetical protein
VTPEELEKEKAWALWAAERDDGACVSVGGLYVKMKKFPPPDTSKMTSDEAAAAVAAWWEKVRQWERENDAKRAAEPSATVPPAPSDTPQAPVA